MVEVEVLSAEVCPYAHRTRLVLLEKGVNFNLTEIDLKNKPDWFPDVSPYGKVPSIRRNGRIVYESAIINEYLDEAFPLPQLMPQQPLERALARIWIDYANTRFNPTVYKLLRELDAIKQAELTDELVNVFRYMENEGFKKLGNGLFWMGQQLTLVDLAFYPFFERLCNLKYYRDFDIPVDCTQIQEWINTMSLRTSVQTIRNPPEFYIERARATALPM